MDPNKALQELRQTVSHILAEEGQNARGRDDAWALDYVCEHFQALDEWLSKGGFLPDEWERS